jgi:1-acyl-sn-glycerol-3-phosphate acyltransferase
MPKRQGASAGGIDSIYDLADRLDGLDRMLAREIREHRATLRPTLPRPLADALARVREMTGADELLESERLAALLLEVLYRRWWHAAIGGIEHVPLNGPALLVANRSGGGYAYDATLMDVVLRHEHPGARSLQDLDGGAHGTRREPRARTAAALRRLRAGELVATFPEGGAGIRKRATRRPRLGRFRATAFATMASRSGAPIIPVAITVRSDDSLLSRLRAPVERIGLRRLAAWNPVLAVVPTAGLWSIRFGEPVHADAEGTDRARIVRLIRGRITTMLGT